MFYDKEIKTILNELPPESIFLDYKVNFYDDNKKYELIKDVVALMNGIASYEQNKFLIFGINDQRKIIGLKKPLPDDSFFQQILWNNIEPKIKHIISGQTTFNDKNIGYLIIDKVNNEVPYQISSKLKKPNWKISAGQRFIRFGSINKVMEPRESDELTTIKLLKGNFKDEVELIKNLNVSVNKIKSDHSNNDFTGIADFNPENNNGIYSIGKNEYLFNVKFDVATNDVVRVYGKGYGGHYDVGYKKTLPVKILILN